MFEGRHRVNLPFETYEGEASGLIDLEAVLGIHNGLHCVIGMSGLGLMGVGSPSKFSNEEVIPAIESGVTQFFGFSPTFQPISFENDQMKPRFWGEDIRAKFGYNRNNRLYLKVSSEELSELLNDEGFLSDHFKNGTVKHIRGSHPSLGYVDDDGTEHSGRFKVRRKGTIKCDFFNTAQVYDFYRERVSSGLLEGH